jgi:hypothetical protein
MGKEITNIFLAFILIGLVLLLLRPQKHPVNINTNKTIENATNEIKTIEKVVIQDKALVTELKNDIADLKNELNNPPDTFTIVKIQKEIIYLQDSTINKQDTIINNLETIIEKKDTIINEHERINKRLKWQRNGALILTGIITTVAIWKE